MLSRLREVARERPDQTAIGDEESALTFAELVARAEAIARWLPERAVVMLALPGGAAYTAAQYGAFGARAVAAPIPDKSTAREARGFLEVVRPDVVLVASLRAQAPLLEALDAPAVVVAGDGDVALGALPGGHRVVRLADVLAGTAARPHAGAGGGLPQEARMVQFTSGSTSTPKGVVLSERNLLANLAQNEAHLRRFAGRSVFCPVPQFHAMGGAVVMEHLGFGSAVHLANRFVPGDDLARLQRHACAGLLASPNYCKLALRMGVLDGKRLPALESFTLGTAAIDQALVSELRERFPKATVHCRYGLSEAVGAMTRLELAPGDPLSDPRLVGPLVSGLAFAPSLVRGADEPGEIRVRGGSVAIGRLVARGRFEPLCDADGFLSTGDLGCLDDQGMLHLRGRISTFLKSGGYRVNPFEIEALLREIPGVQEAVVVGVPDPLLGERLVACLEPSPGHTPPSQEALLAACHGQLALYKVPSRFVVMARLPRTQAGKPDRARVRDEVAR
jgi:acyl-CoA synthetase (AMP-forming)/AMP-acid ligase II